MRVEREGDDVFRISVGGKEYWGRGSITEGCSMKKFNVDLPRLSAIINRELIPHLRDAGFVIASPGEKKVVFLIPVELTLPADGYDTCKIEDNCILTITQEKQP